MDAINEYKEFSKLLESAKEGINPNCKDCGGTGYDSHPNHMTTYPICLSCEAWANSVLSGGIFRIYKES